jgi:hypothetical protein
VSGLVERSPAMRGNRQEQEHRSREQVCWGAGPCGCCLNCEGRRQRWAHSSSCLAL